MTIDVEAESQQLRERSADLAAQLDAAVVTVDRTPIAEALAESDGLAAAADAARAEVARRLARGEPAGVGLGPVGPIRRVRDLPNGQDADPVLRGRATVTRELGAYHVHRRDVVAAAYRDAFGRAGQQYEPRASLVAAARGHLTELRRRESFGPEGGAELDAALRRFLDSAGVLREGLREADDIAASAEAALKRLGTAPMMAELEDTHGPMHMTNLNQWLVGRVSQALGGEPVDATTGRPVEAKR
jgi:hypothetical protein